MTGTNYHPPRITGISLNTNSISINSPIEITLAATDDNGTVDSVYVVDGSDSIGYELNEYKASVSFRSGGVKMPSLYVVDNDGLYSKDTTFNITVTTDIPTVKVGATTASGNINTPIKLIAKGSDTDGEVTHYLWAIDAGAFDTNTDKGEYSPTFGAKGTYTVRVKAVDEDNFQSTYDSTIVTVTEGAPELNTITQDTSVYVNDSVTLRAEASDNGTITSFIWAKDSINFMDTIPGTTGEFKTSFTAPGVYSVRVKAIDNDGQNSNEGRIKVTVSGVGPIITKQMPDTTVVQNDSVTVWIEAKVNQGTIENYYWAFDGINFLDQSKVPQFKTTFSELKEYNVLVKVVDDLGNEKILANPIKITAIEGNQFAVFGSHTFGSKYLLK